MKQFEMAMKPRHKDIIRWTGKGHEFRLLDVAEIVERWATLKNKPGMSYECMSRNGTAQNARYLHQKFKIKLEIKVE
jgi:hypothetical protein